MQTPDQDAALDLDQLRDLTFADRKLMREILSALIDDTSRQAALLAIAIDEGDARRSRRLARLSARACANVGATAAAEALQAIARGAASGQFGESRDSLDRLRLQIDRLRSEIMGL